MKKYLIFILLFLTYGCGYSTIYKDVQKKNFEIKIINSEGNKEINNIIKNHVKLVSTPNSKNLININLETNYEKITISKDATGVATNYKLDIEINFKLNLNGKNYNINFEDSLKVQSNSNSYEQLNYEKSIKENFARLAVNELMIKLVSLNDN